MPAWSRFIVTLLAPHWMKEIDDDRRRMREEAAKQKSFHSTKAHGNGGGSNSRDGNADSSSREGNDGSFAAGDYAVADNLAPVMPTVKRRRTSRDKQSSNISTVSNEESYFECESPHPYEKDIEDEMEDSIEEEEVEEEIEAASKYGQSKASEGFGERQENLDVDNPEEAGKKRKRSTEDHALPKKVAVICRGFKTRSFDAGPETEMSPKMTAPLSGVSEASASQLGGLNASLDGDEKEKVATEQSIYRAVYDCKCANGEFLNHTSKWFTQSEWAQRMSMLHDKGSLGWSCYKHAENTRNMRTITWRNSEAGRKNIQVEESRMSQEKDMKE